MLCNSVLNIYSNPIQSRFSDPDPVWHDLHLYDPDPHFSNRKDLKVRIRIRIKVKYVKMIKDIKQTVIQVVI